ncbi:DDE-type integrase/transposase/recombinase [Oceanivirga salmonicida]|nr:DDE-type integrase/transposase/recombinase [Oceanivirga salmonicida]
MSIIQCFTNNIQYFNLINSNLELQASINTLTEENKKLKKALTSSKKINSKLKTKIKKLLGTYIDPKDDTSHSPVYEYFKLDKEAIKTPIIDEPLLDYKQILSNGNYKHSKAYLKPDFPYPEQICPNCSSTKEWHYLHTKIQKRCKLCFKTFIFNNAEPEIDISNFYCPYCSKKLGFRVSRTAFDVYVCKNKKCSYRKQRKLQIIDKFGKLNKQDKISYIYRDIKLSINNVFKFIKDSELDKPKTNFIFRNFNSKIFSLVISYKVNLKLSNRDTASAMKDFYDIDISHTTINTYCSMAAKLVIYLNTINKSENISNNIVGDETYIKIKGKKHYVWILYDLIHKNLITYHISEKRDFNACATVFLKLIECYK